MQPALSDTKREASPEEVEAAFRRAFPAYGDTGVLDELRRSGYARLDEGGHVYLDYTGAGLYADSQLTEHLQLLRSGVFGNPHSLNPTSSAATEAVEQARAALLEFFRASPDEYLAIFTPNAIGALRLVGEGPIRSTLATASCSPSTTTTRSTASASSPAPAAPRRSTCRASPPACASTRSCFPAT